MRLSAYLLILVLALVWCAVPAVSQEDASGDGESVSGGSEDVSSESGDWKEGFLIEDETEQIPQFTEERDDQGGDPIKMKIQALENFDVREVMARKREGTEEIISLQTPGFGRVDPFLIPATIPDDLRDLVFSEDWEDIARTQEEIYAAQMTQLAGQVPIYIRGVIDNGAQAYVEIDILGYGRFTLREGGGSGGSGAALSAPIVTKDYVQIVIQLSPGAPVSRSFSRGNSDFGGSLGRIRNQGGGGGGRGGGGRGGGRGGGGGRG